MNKHLGFHLIELLACISIMGIIMAISFPALKNFLSQTQDEILYQQLSHAIQLARSEASARHAPVAFTLDEYGDGVIHDDKQIIFRMKSSRHCGKIIWRSYPHYRKHLIFSATGLCDNATFWHYHGKHLIWTMTVSKSGRTRIIYSERS